MMSKSASKPRNAKLKVFRTAVGFHDSYVAAPSRKAALAAWGTDKDLFARGVAEEVTDPALMAEPLSAPGTVFRQLRPMPSEESEVKPGQRPASRAPEEDAAPRHAMQPVPPPPPPPRPSDTEVAEAERALETALEHHAEQQRDLAARESELARERRAMEAQQEGEERRLESKLKEARKDHEAQLKAWRKAVDKDHRT
jgi:type IV secretory pathway VirB10-like protein